MFIIEQYFASRLYENVQGVLQEKYSSSPDPHKTTIEKLVDRVRKGESEADKKRSGRPWMLTGERWKT
jgi:transposase